MSGLGLSAPKRSHVNIPEPTGRHLLFRGERNSPPFPPAQNPEVISRTSVKGPALHSQPPDHSKQVGGRRIKWPEQLFLA